ncbi:sulfur carrier protein ThiS [Clostridium sp. 'White wine YQ']|uniref:sulfur carrier protein ThiS n=1 Tax=Clostridium sp. 'White wine YQ' TaxID=3027474 RepID=UPI0023656B26|nr:sulfur carrier protein ThiS [Clostridium sp. 'White wine YQ']MDD7794432.1 sulfur carrier protein ThiS [Clostridium sp. 'White wine YQ']
MKVNGTSISLESSKSLLDFLSEQNYDVTKIAVELNGDIVPKAAYKDTMLYDEDTIEVVRFVGGG